MNAQKAKSIKKVDLSLLGQVTADAAFKIFKSLATEAYGIEGVVMDYLGSRTHGLLDPFEEIADIDQLSRTRINSSLQNHASKGRDIFQATHMIVSALARPDFKLGPKTALFCYGEWGGIPHVVFCTRTKEKLILNCQPAPPHGTWEAGDYFLN